MIALLVAAALEVTELPTVTVYASRIDATADALPSSAVVLEGDAIERANAHDVPDLLVKEANLQIRTLNANPLEARVALRGFGETAFGRVRIIVDGEDLNAADMSPPNLAHIPLAAVSRIEILPGPSPVLYGDGAIAGVINVTTDSRDCGRKTSLAVRGGSYGTFGLNVRTQGGFETNGLTYAASYDYAHSDGYRNRSGYDLHTFAASLGERFANGSRLGFRTHYENALYELPGALTKEQFRRDPRQSRYGNDWCRLWSYGFSADMKARLAEDQWLYLDAAFTHRHRHSHWGDYGYANAYDLYGFQLSPRYVNETPLGDFDSVFTFGLDFKYESYFVKDRSGWYPPRYDFARMRYAAFAHEEFFITDVLSLVVGGRVEALDNRWSCDLGLDENTSYDVMGDCEIALVYRPWDALKTYAKGTHFHRSAFCDELSYTQDGSFLVPETGESLDLGLDWAFDEEWLFSLSGYWTVMRDEIFYNPYAKDYGGGVWGGYNCNSPDDTERLGCDAALTWRREKVAEASLRESFVHTRFCDGAYDGCEIPLVPQSRTRAEAGVWIIDDLEAKVGACYVSAQHLSGDYANVHERLGGYALFDAGLYYAPRWCEGLKGSLVADNLLNRRYADFAGWSDYGGAYYYPALGRSFMLTVRYDF